MIKCRNYNIKKAICIHLFSYFWSLSSPHCDLLPTHPKNILKIFSRKIIFCCQTFLISHLFQETAREPFLKEKKKLTERKSRPMHRSIKTCLYSMWRVSQFHSLINKNLVTGKNFNSKRNNIRNILVFYQENFPTIQNYYCCDRFKCLKLFLIIEYFKNINLIKNWPFFLN